MLFRNAAEQKLFRTPAAHMEKPQDVGLRTPSPLGRRGTLFGNSLRNAGKSISEQQRFIQRGSQAVLQRKISTTIASFLPTGLLEQLHYAVIEEHANPRLPQVRLGVYLCIAFSGLHALAVMPTAPGEFEEQLRDTFAKIAQHIEESGGELLRISGEMALAVWPLPPSLELPQDSPGSSVDTQLTGRELLKVREAVHAASSCALALLEDLDETIMWSEQGRDEKMRLQAQRKARAAVSPEPSSRSPPSTGKLLGGSPLKRSLWGGARTLAQSKRDQSKANRSGRKLSSGGGNSGLNFLDVAKIAAARKAAGQGSAEHKFQVSASITLANAAASHVGGANGRWEYLICSPEVTTALRVLTQAQTGELLVSQSVWTMLPPAALQPHMVLDEWKKLASGTSMKSMDADAAITSRHALMNKMPLAAMRSYVPGSIWAKILAGDPKWIVNQSEERIVTVLVTRMWAPQNAPLLSQVAAYTAVRRSDRTLQSSRGGHGPFPFLGVRLKAPLSHVLIPFTPRRQPPSFRTNCTSAPAPSNT